MTSLTYDEVVSRRRSVRAYDPSRPVSREEIETMIATALEAPSWKNQQTSRYHIALSPEKLAETRACLSERNQGKVKDAPALVVTTFVKDIVGFDLEGKPDNEIGNGWGIYDLGLQNALFLLKAAELGVDSLIMGLRDADALRRTLNIPDNEIIVSVIALGHRLDDPQRPPRKSTSEIAKFY